MKNESWPKAAARGLQEELHLTATSLKDLGCFYPDPGGLDQKLHLYLAQGLKPTDNHEKYNSHKEVEILNIRKFTREEINGLIAKQEICDNWTLAALFLYDRYRK